LNPLFCTLAGELPRPFMADRPRRDGGAGSAAAARPSASGRGRGRA